MEPLPLSVAPLARSHSDDEAPNAGVEAQPQPSRLDPTVVSAEAIPLDGLAHGAQSQPPRTGEAAGQAPMISTSSVPQQPDPTAVARISTGSNQVDTSPSDSPSPASSREGSRTGPPRLDVPARSSAFSLRPATPVGSTGQHQGAGSAGQYPGGYVSPRSRTESWTADQRGSRGSSVKRPVAEGPPKLKTTLDNDDARESLGKSMQKEFSRENLDFMQACSNFQSLSRDNLLDHPQQKHEFLKNIVKQFVGQQAAGQINLFSGTQLDLLMAWRDAEETFSNEGSCDYNLLFVAIDAAVDEIDAVVRRDTLPRHLLQSPEPTQARKPSFSDRVSATMGRFSDKARQKISPNNPPPKEGSDRWVPRFATQRMKDLATPILMRRRQQQLAPRHDEEIKGAPPNREVADEIRAVLAELEFDSLVQPASDAYGLAIQSLSTLRLEPAGIGHISSSSSSSSNVGASASAAAVNAPEIVRGTFASLMAHCDGFVRACETGGDQDLKTTLALAIEEDFEDPEFTCPGPTNTEVLEVLRGWRGNQVSDPQVVSVIRALSLTAEPLEFGA